MGKQYGLKSIDLKVNSSEIVGIIGHNGSGKTVLMKCICGFITPDSGEITVSGKHVGKYSLGMKQRLGIAQAIMENPDILILDEPMNGLDKNGVEEMRKLLLQLKDDGKAIIIASHNSVDIDVLCDKVFEITKGTLAQVR